MQKTLRFLTLLIVLVPLCSCSTTKSAERDIASKECIEKVKPEYQSYFDNVEKCIENKRQE